MSKWWRAERTASSASSSPEMTSTVSPTSCATRAMNSLPLAASRTALVATASMALT